MEKLFPFIVTFLTLLNLGFIAYAYMWRKEYVAFRKAFDVKHDEESKIAEVKTITDILKKSGIKLSEETNPIAELKGKESVTLTNGGRDAAIITNIKKQSEISDNNDVKVNDDVTPDYSHEALNEVCRLAAKYLATTEKQKEAYIGIGKIFPMHDKHLLHIIGTSYPGSSFKDLLISCTTGNGSLVEAFKWIRREVDGETQNSSLSMWLMSKRVPGDVINYIMKRSKVRDEISVQSKDFKLTSKHELSEDIPYSQFVYNRIKPEIEVKAACELCILADVILEITPGRSYQYHYRSLIEDIDARSHALTPRSINDNIFIGLLANCILDGQDGFLAAFKYLGAKGLQGEFSDSPLSMNRLSEWLLNNDISEDVIHFVLNRKPVTNIDEKQTVAYNHLELSLYVIAEILDKNVIIFGTRYTDIVPSIMSGQDICKIHGSIYSIDPYVAYMTECKEGGYETIKKALTFMCSNFSECDPKTSLATFLLKQNVPRKVIKTILTNPNL